MSEANWVKRFDDNLVATFLLGPICSIVRSPYECIDGFIFSVLDDANTQGATMRLSNIRPCQCSLGIK